MLLRAYLVDLGDKWVSQRRSQSKNIVDDALFEGCSTRVNMIQSADLDDQFQSTLTHFGILMHTPLASELCDLLIVFTDYHLEGARAELFPRLYHH